MENSKFYVTAEELSEAYGICMSKAYKLIRQLNAELEAKGFIIVQAKVPRKYLEERIYGYSPVGANSHEEGPSSEGEAV